MGRTFVLQNKETSMNIEYIIRTIILHESLISIKGLGTFISHNQPARIIKSDFYKFIPPQKNIVFSEHTYHEQNDIEHVLKTEYPHEFEYLSTELSTNIERIRGDLQLHKKSKFVDIGSFYVDDNQNIIFEFEAEDAPHNYFGLPDFSLQHIPSLIEEEDTKKKNPRSLATQAAKITFLLFPILFGLLLIPNILHLPQMAGLMSIFSSKDTIIDFTTPRKPLPSLEAKDYYAYRDTATDIAALRSEENMADTTDLTLVAEQLPAEEFAEPATQYYIIVGSFSTESNAQKYVKALQTQLYTDAEIIISDSKIRVSIAKSTSIDETKSQLEMYKTHKDFSTAWILIV